MKNHFEALIIRLSPTIRSISHRLNGHSTFFNDDDLCQEAFTFIWVLSKRGKLDDKTDSYILQGCYFHLKNYIRTALDRANIISLDEPIDEEGTSLEEIIASNNITPDYRMEDKPLFEDIQKSGLGNREIEVLQMFAEGFTTREIGSKLGISHVAVVKMRQKIREKCKNLK